MAPGGSDALKVSFPSLSFEVIGAAMVKTPRRAVKSTSKCTFVSKNWSGDY